MVYMHSVFILINLYFFLIFSVFIFTLLMQVCVIIKAIGHLGTDAYFVAVMAWLLLLVVLSFFVHVLDNVIEAIYVCYAIDRDRGDVYKQEVHEVYVHLPISRSHRPAFNARTPDVV